MKMKKSHYTNYLISVAFDERFVPDTLQGKIEMCENFLIDLGKLARKSGKRLHSTYSIVMGLNGYHAHFGVSWLPLVQYRVKNARMSEQPIARHAVVQLLEQNYYYVNNTKEAIKKVTHDKPFVTSYITEQPKDGQSTIETGFYIHNDFVPTCSEKKMHSYCSKQQFGVFENQHSKERPNRAYLIFLISVVHLILISSLLLSLF